MVNEDPSEPLLALVGPTASGKSEAALQLAEGAQAEIVSVDSMLVYRGMDVGTAKPSLAERERVPHHLVDVVAPSEDFSVSRFQALAGEAIAGIRARGARVLLVGGSGLYFRAVVDQLEFPGTDTRTRADLESQAEAAGAEGLYARLAALDPDAARKIEPGNVRRTVRALEVATLTGRAFSTFAAGWEHYPQGRVRAAGVRIAPDALRRRIQSRVRAMHDAGFVDEVRGLVAHGFGGWLTSAQAIGYAEVARHLAGELPIEEAVALTVKRTRALARRQMAWFRRDPRVRWFDAGEEGAASIVDQLREYLDRG